tara:strand:- start:350 stop:778 length:429 start_codon:yes stop_codon:yes gene_type:complete
MLKNAAQWQRNNAGTCCIKPRLQAIKRQLQGGRLLLQESRGRQEMTETSKDMIPLWEVFIRPRTGLAHSHVGSIHAADEVMALQAARDVYTRRGEGVSIWVVPSASITASDPEQRDENFEPSASKIYRHPSFYDIPDDVGHM